MEIEVVVIVLVSHIRIRVLAVVVAWHSIAASSDLTRKIWLLYINVVD